MRLIAVFHLLAAFSPFLFLEPCVLFSAFQSLNILLKYSPTCTISLPAAISYLSQTLAVKQDIVTKLTTTMDVPYLRRVLIPFWVIQLIFIIISLGDSAYLLSVYAQGQTENGTCGDYYNGYYDCSVTVTAPPILLAYVLRHAHTLLLPTVLLTSTPNRLP